MGVKVQEAINRNLWLTFASSFEFSVLSAFRSPSSFSIFAFNKCSSSFAIFNCSSVRWTLRSGVTRTSRRHQGQSRTCINARTLRWMQRTASSCRLGRNELSLMTTLHALDIHLNTSLTDTPPRQIATTERLQLYDAI